MSGRQRVQILVDNILSRWTWESSVKNPSRTREILREYAEKGIKSDDLIPVLRELTAIPPDEGQNYVVINSAKQLLERLSKSG